MILGRVISIHALLAESDHIILCQLSAPYISIHALLAESDRKITITVDDGTIISIHALLAESDQKRMHQFSPKTISIHALLAESDALAPEENPTQKNFYPRSPCGERRGSGVGSWPHRIFLSTLSLRRATLDGSESSIEEVSFLSTLSLRRATVEEVSGDTWTRDFYPRSPCGERQYNPTKHTNLTYFYPRSPCGERRVHYDNYNLHCTISIHALLAESDCSLLTL